MNRAWENSQAPRAEAPRSSCQVTALRHTVMHTAFETDCNTF